MDVDVPASAKSRPKFDLASKRSLHRRKSSTAFKKHIRQDLIHRPPTSVQQIIDLSRDWSAPLNLNIDRESYPIPCLDPSKRLYSHTKDIYLDYSAHVPHLSDRRFFNDVASSVSDVHLKKPKKSVFYIIDHDRFESLSSQEVQDIFRHQHIVVTDVLLGRPVEFNRKGLETLCPWKKPKIMQDFSIPLKDNNYSKRQVIGSLQLLYEHSQSSDGRVLNALDFPLASGPSPTIQLSSDLRAWDSTMDSPLAARTVEYPVNHMRWGLVATKGAQHTWHIDSMGVGTCVQIKTGSKYWVVGQPKDEREDIIHIDDESVDIDISASNVAIWNLEGMLLRPGMLFFMRPNTPHAVFTTEHCITYGSHFIATSTLSETCYGLVHSFISSSAITNADNKSVWMVLQRLACYYHQIFTNGDWNEPDFDASHIPDISTSSGVIDLYTFMVVLELANVLHGSSYSDNGLDKMDRLRIIEARRLARELRKWTVAHFIVKMANRPEEDIFDWMLASMCIRLLRYLKEAKKHNIQPTSPSCTVKKMSEEIYSVINNNSAVLGLIRNHRDALKGKSIKWTEPVIVTRRSKPSQCDISIGIYSTTGYTAGDFSYFSTTKSPPSNTNLNTLFFGRT